MVGLFCHLAVDPNLQRPEALRKNNLFAPPSAPAERAALAAWAPSRLRKEARADSRGPAARTPSLPKDPQTTRNGYLCAGGDSLRAGSPCESWFLSSKDDP